VDTEAYKQKVQDFVRTRMEAAAKKTADAGAAYVEKASKEAGATKTASGMVIKQTREGTGASPKAEDEVKVHYEGRLVDGKVFDSSIARGEPATFPLNGVIPCWTEGVQTMKVGGKAQFVCPAELAYGPNGHPPAIPPQSTLVFDVELLDIVKPQAAPGK
ncbi:MAG TPA: FKBP-type peptidyl-prolyl cis-trans isomerase, partial [Steroidobacteraceae bacterium]|nr:FKBP-type peptidyl-prolyl cis-trans isomerase [Steroidobacteraceae bacterium]